VTPAEAALIDTPTIGSYFRRMDNSQELLLLEQIRAGDEAGFATLMREHAPKVVGLATRLLGDRSEAEDLAQEAFLRLHRALPGFRGDSSIGTWLYRTTTRLAIDHLRRERLKRRIFFFRASDDDPDPLETVSDPRSNPARDLHARQAMQRLRRGMQKLSARQRAVFVLRHHEGLPLQEIADLLGVETGTVKAHLHRAVTTLRAELADVYEETP
jgi:RNA polymerase sigma-70 factor (ECF subfamily)